MENYRDIMLASDPGKCIASTVRGHVNTVARSFVNNTQYGSGLNKGNAEYAHLYVKAAVDCAEIRSLSVSVLFLDVKTAFAAMLRHFVLPSQESEPQKLLP